MKLKNSVLKQLSNAFLGGEYKAYCQAFSCAVFYYSFYLSYKREEMEHFAFSLCMYILDGLLFNHSNRLFRFAV